MNKLAQIMTIANGSEVILSGNRLLKKQNKTEFEQQAAKAYKRSIIGTLILVALFLITTMLVIINFFPAFSDNASRRGTVEEGQVHYVQNTMIYVTLEEIGLENAGLKDGDHVYLYFDHSTDEFVEAFPAEYVTNYENTSAAIILGTLIFWIVMLLFYPLVICRLTPWGKAWTLYCKQRQKPEKESPVVIAICLLIALIICWPQLSAILDNCAKMRELDAQRAIFQQGYEAGEKAKEFQERLEEMSLDGEVSDEVQGHIDDVNNATNKIKEAMDNLNKLKDEE